MSEQTSIIPESSGINPNSAVGDEGTAVSRANDIIGFADLANLTDGRASKKGSQQSQKSEDGDGPKKESKAKAAAKESEASGDSDRERKAASDAKSSAAKSGGDDAGREAKDEKGQGRAKLLKAKAGDKELDLPADAVFTAKIDGKEETTATLQELINDYSGRQSLDRKASVFRKERETFEGRVKSLNTHVEELFKKAQQSPESALDYLADIAGKDPVEVKMNALKANIDSLKVFFSMTESEQARWLKEKELEFKDAKFKRRDEITQATEKTAKEQAAMRELAGKYGIDEEAYNGAASQAREFLGREPTPEEVVKSHKALGLDQTIRNLVPDLSPESEQYREVFDLLFFEAMRNPRYGEAEIAEDLAQAFGARRVKAISRRESKHSQTSKPTQQVKPQHEDIFSFDQL
jgi:hypothetical protein